MKNPSSCCLLFNVVFPSKAGKLILLQYKHQNSLRNVFTQKKLPLRSHIFFTIYEHLKLLHKKLKTLTELSVSKKESALKAET